MDNVHCGRKLSKALAFCSVNNKSNNNRLANFFSHNLVHSSRRVITTHSNDCSAVGESFLFTAFRTHSTLQELYTHRSVNGPPLAVVHFSTSLQELNYCRSFNPIHSHVGEVGGRQRKGQRERERERKVLIHIKPSIKATNRAN